MFAFVLQSCRTVVAAVRFLVLAVVASVVVVVVVVVVVAVSLTAVFVAALSSSADVSRDVACHRTGRQEVRHYSSRRGTQRSESFLCFPGTCVKACC